jgi:hypothetical protein
MKSVFLVMKKKLRQMGLFLKKDDIQREYLLPIICGQSVFGRKEISIFSRMGSNFINTLRWGLPLHRAAEYSTIQEFRVVFEYGIRYYPIKKLISLLFRKNEIYNTTPFQLTCRKYGRVEVMKVIEDTLLEYQRSHSHHDSASATGPYNVVDALISAAIDENVHFRLCIFTIIGNDGCGTGIQR